MGMSTTVSAAEANRQFSRILRAVESGETVIVTSHGRPVARICPVDEDSERRRVSLQHLLDRLATQPAMNLAKTTREEMYER
jgi:prevent-host-death family protein